VLRREADIEKSWQMLGSAPLIYEAFVPFDREVSIIGARSTRGEIRCYPLSLNTHREGILRVTLAPYRHAALQKQAEAYLKRVLNHFDYAGVLTIEFFVQRGRLIANEMAPRVHNSGHWTIEGADTSQFENHLRAILGLPLGSTATRGHAAMINFIGTIPDREQVLKVEQAHLHHYGKEPRPQRKLGHATLVRASAKERDRSLQRLLHLVKSTA
jgi:5-(carboxyamino)imidazole ribonucleotide synthase